VDQGGEVDGGDQPPVRLVGEGSGHALFQTWR
jgi:hypothetical protein